MRQHAAFRRTAHDPGDPMVVSHCPFCGSGQVFGLSDGGISCELCGQTYLVRVQPAFPGMPQSPMGPGAPTDVGPEGPIMPGDEMGMDPEMGPPGAEGDEEDGGDGAPPWAGGGDDEGAEEDGGPPADDDDSGPPPPKSKKKGARHTAGRADTPENRKHYRRGWLASDRYGQSASPSDVSPLERADYRGEHPAWYDGYMDSATGRPRYHSLTCPAADHERDPQCTLNSGWQGSADASSNSFRASRTYRTVAGDQLTESAYIRHLAALHGGPRVLARLRHEAAAR